jgi:hypothetical protein
MDNLPSFPHQAVTDPPPVTLPWQSLGTDKCPNKSVPDLFELGQPFQVGGGETVFLIPTPSITAQFIAEVEIGKPVLPQALLKHILSEMVEPAGWETSDIYNGLNPIGAKKGYEFIHGSRAGPKAIDPLPFCPAPY